ncbi:MAG: hypothetical protein AAF081_04010 [Actinomycetota bacterium]
MATLVPLPLAAVVLDPRAPHRVPPGFGWWTTDGVELAPTDSVDAAVDEVAALVASAQAETGIGPAATVLVGYSKGRPWPCASPPLVRTSSQSSSRARVGFHPIGRPGRPADPSICSS